MIVQTTENLITIPDSLLLSIIGFLVVFIALVALIIVIKIISGLSNGQKTDVPAIYGQPAQASPINASGEMVPATGSLGELELFDVDDHSAVLIMAIVADNLKVPLCTLRFKSIRQLKEGQ